jgi:hypothetical protein
MSEPLPQRTTSEPVEATPEIAGTLGVSFIYLHFD